MKGSVFIAVQSAFIGLVAAFVAVSVLGIAVRVIAPGAMDEEHSLVITGFAGGAAPLAVGDVVELRRGGEILCRTAVRAVERPNEAGAVGVALGAEVAGIAHIGLEVWLVSQTQPVVGSHV